MPEPQSQTAELRRIKSHHLTDGQRTILASQGLLYHYRAGGEIYEAVMCLTYLRTVGYVPMLHVHDEAMTTIDPFGGNTKWKKLVSEGRVVKVEASEVGND